MLQEARQRSLTQRKPMRVEINLTDGIVRLINERETNTVDDDQVLREAALLPANEVAIRVRPPDITTNPTEALPVPIAQFRQSIYPSSVLDDVATIRFMPNGTVVNEGTSPTGSNAPITGLTLFVWSAKKGNVNESEIARAITVVGATGSIRLWEYDWEARDANKWKDSRRTGTYGGQTTNSNVNANL